MFRGVMYALISACSFGILPIMGKFGFECGMDTFEILQYRFIFGSLMLALFFAVTRPSLLRISPRALMKAAMLGLLVYPVQSTGFIGAVKYIPASTTSLIIYGYPALVTILSAVFFKQPITKSLTTSLVLIFAGCALVFYDAFLQEADIRGVLLAVGCMVGIAGNMILSQVLLKGENAQSVTLYVLFFAAIFFSAMAGGPATILDLNGRGLALALGIGLVPTVFAILFMYLAIEHIGGTYTSIFSCIEPVTTVFAAWILLGEPVAMWQFVGAALVICGVIWPNRKLLHREMTPTHAA
jgi:drug/metabolite transporter (DMT)-like permease